MPVNVTELHTAIAAARQLTATTRRLSASDATNLDLLRFCGDDGRLFMHDGVGLATRGAALTISMPHGTTSVDHVEAILRAITIDDPLQRAGSGPAAFGALPFTPGEAGWLHVPSTIVAKSGDGSAWCTQITTAASSPNDQGPGTDSSLWEWPDFVAESRTAWSPHSFELKSSVTHEQWCETIAKAITKIKAGEMEKVVLARSVDVVASDPFIVSEILTRLHALFPSCMVFSMDGFIGASPELLVSRKGSALRAHPLAGTIARSGDSVTDAKLAAALLASPKDRWEHSLVLRVFHELLEPLCDELDIPSTPSIVSLRNVSHLGTLITGSLRARDVADAKAPSALQLAGMLNPTAAVGGVPTEAALKCLAELEPQPRGSYAGPVGWVDSYGNGEWAVGLRSAQIEGNRARMFAGGGIVADSDPMSELVETQLKLQALLAAVVRP
jgi:menaquinone-specific isochorismate synthase